MIFYKFAPLIVFAIASYYLLGVTFFNTSESSQKVSKELQTNITYHDTETSISNLTKNSVLIAWQSQEKEVGSIEYGVIPNVYYTSKSEFDPKNIHKIKLESLNECTKYYYHVSSASVLFDKENDHFTTLCDTK